MLLKYIVYILIFILYRDVLFTYGMAIRSYSGGAQTPANGIKQPRF